jgi:hypothetical protein
MNSESQNRYLVNNRRLRPGPELDLIQSFIDAMPLDIPQGCQATIFREPHLESGFPDIVIVFWRKEIALNWQPERENLKVYDLRLMHFLHHTRRASKNEIVSWFGRRATTSIERLYNAAMIRLAGSYWIPCALSRSFATSKIIAIEAKMSKWTEVLNQAFLNTWFASESYVLVPKIPSLSQLSTARKLGIGVWSLNNCEVASESTRLPRSYASWVLNDWAWRSFQNMKGETR